MHQRLQAVHAWCTLLRLEQCIDKNYLTCAATAKSPPTHRCHVNRLNRDRCPDVNFNPSGSNVSWSSGVGPMASFTEAITVRVVEGLSEEFGPFKHVIKVDLKPSPMPTADGGGITSIKHQLAIAAAKELGLLDQEYNRLKQEYEAVQYYSYGSNDLASYNLEHYVKDKIVPWISRKLSTEKYLLVVKNLRWWIEPSNFTRDVRLPPPSWENSHWFISTITKYAGKRSKSSGDQVISIHVHAVVVVLALYSLHHSAEHIFNMTRQENKEYWHHIALLCFHYATLIFTKHSPVVPVTSDELIHQWAAQGILPRMPINGEEEETGNCTYSSRCAYMHRVGRIILEAFQKYSLLRLPYSPANNADRATGTAAQFFSYHGLITEDITVDALFENKKNWITFVDDHGWHVSREWLSPKENRGATALILRGCSQQSLIFSKLDHFLLKLCFLRILDLSYTPLKSLPSSVGSLLYLRLLSLRGCHDLETLSSTNTTSSNSPLSTLYQLEILDMNGVPFSHLTQDVANQKSNLIFLDMSYSQVTSFPPNFFQGMSNLEELVLVNCSKLVELPPSMVALSSLTTLEIAGTQIKYFPKKIFDEMQKLQSLKLIDNKKLFSLLESISRAQGLIGLHIEGYESSMVEEIKLEGHPTLTSFILIRAPHIRRLSLRGCRKLESVKFKNLDALEDLDLSATAIKELLAGIPNVPHLRRLILVGVPSLRRFPWHMLGRLPDVFYLDHCIEGNGNHSDHVARIRVSDPRFFHSFCENFCGFSKRRTVFPIFLCPSRTMPYK
ncbi:hypothetical protein BRADI_2g39440v3 [Brachypodium distachyon]|uniref:Uncharacterized protein n=1 Tax=Brachypodium distachyon TaxID=15368 RepID=A0A0Q3R3G1_BRADI|nr:hypothetical protein BRADI_2g39440v3 [Brachypodium distachyon]